jgi:hypothetical protein
MLLSLPLNLTLILNAVNSSTDEANVGISLLQYARALCDMKVETFSVQSFEKDDHFGLISSDASFSWNRSVEEDLREECSRLLCAVSQKYFTARDCTDSPFQDSNMCQPCTHSETDSYVNSSSDTNSASSIKPTRTRILLPTQTLHHRLVVKALLTPVISMSNLTARRNLKTLMTSTAITMMMIMMTRMTAWKKYTVTMLLEQVKIELGLTKKMMPTQITENYYARVT